jgi:hypothetical protein
MVVQYVNKLINVELFLRNFLESSTKQKGSGSGSGSRRPINYRCTGFGSGTLIDPYCFRNGNSNYNGEE